ncbi:hypothetical protein HFP15_14750 [Amycolatopsis sp. K13G38]|uniref:Uncharacterized protein n=1 Tax=Amycolatopsis acididurans TaxID=2724524 RepID=A0ABX1J723_9PSEU|nr:hypothetical protein [Amycolatopsis acididurans]NKQ54145.1 hypothetical protein [Amycolatopsis acididurans]
MLEADGVGAATRAAQDVWGSGVLAGAVAGAAVGAPAGLASVGAAAAALAGPATGSGGGFEFPSVEEMNAVKGMWQERQVSIQHKQTQISQALRNLSELADDPESQGYLTQTRESLQLLNDQHVSMLKYVENYIQKLTHAANAKQANEENNTAALTSKPEH